MGDFALDTALTRIGDGEWSRVVHPDWVIWGPNGGYMAALALRAAGEIAQRARPANVTIHFLGVASLDEPVVITASPQRTARNATSLRVDIAQAGKPMLAAMVWAVDPGLPGLRHGFAQPPDVPHWRDSPTVQERFAAAGLEYTSSYSFWNNFEQRPATWIADWESREGLPAEYFEWLRFVPTSSFADPWLEAARLLLAVDLGGWPATCQHHNQNEYIAPNIDVSCEFHSLDATDWVLLHGRSEHAGDGLIATRQEVWSDDGRLLAGGISHLLCKSVAPRG
jgi:acyl-CoA thioesterase